MTTPRVAQKAKPEWTRSPIQTRARARKENRDPSTNSAEVHSGLARLRDRNGDRTAAGLASRDMNISNNAAGLPPAPRKTIARPRRITEPTGDPSKLPRRVPYVLAPPRPDPPLSSRVPPPPTNQSTHSVAVPEPSGSVEDDDEKSTVGDSATTVAQSHQPTPGKVKEEPAAEYSARCIDFMKLPRPATRKQRRQTLFFDRPREDMPEAQLNVATLPLAPSSAPVGILITTPPNSDDLGQRWTAHVKSASRSTCASTGVRWDPQQRREMG
ncbi:hypothetical protein FOMPIDRAFT_1059835 [Fomitopsis schrenkii]|uniref:Uncharacterized protein n=1 Tax=Fomitopsis schrenkii TaxID=2126942 RepID=S8EDW7_FOMSC|nr:hypothetical protein FOMPIDRAFT_1059835 [Fomitopsis schrenkii]